MYPAAGGVSAHSGAVPIWQLHSGDRSRTSLTNSVLIPICLKFQGAVPSIWAYLYFLALTDRHRHVSGAQPTEDMAKSKEVTVIGWSPES